MIDFDAIEGFDWDSGNLTKSLAKHDVTAREAEQIFVDGRMLVLVDHEHSAHEERFHGYGKTLDGRRLLVSFTLRRDRTLIRVISVRDMSRKERQRSEQEA
jgi:uncharacterized protein